MIPVTPVESAQACLLGWLVGKVGPLPPYRDGRAKFNGRQSPCAPPSRARTIEFKKTKLLFRLVQFCVLIVIFFFGFVCLFAR